MNDQFTDSMAFLTRVLPKGPYYYDTSTVRPGDPKSWRDKSHYGDSAFSEMVRHTLQQSDAGFNTYFALSAFKQGWHNIPNKAKAVFRTQDNALYQKCLWLDIDCEKVTAAYATMPDGYTALCNFLEHSGMPQPMIINSGQGYHAYWTFDQAVPSATWVKLAARLRALVDHFELKVDPSRTEDLASVLRLPGTLNYGKDGITRPVKVELVSRDYPVKDIAAALAMTCKHYNLNCDVKVYADPAKKPMQDLGIALTPEQAAMFMPDKPMLRDPKNIVQNCRQMQLAHEGYQSWLYMMMVLKFCKNGREVAHILSKRNTDPQHGYDPATTDAKFHNVMETGKGPALCATFDAAKKDICPNCPYWNKVSTPLLIGQVHQEPPQPIKLPEPNIASNAVSEHFTQLFASTIDVTPFQSKDFDVTSDGIIWHQSKREYDEGSGKEIYVIKDHLISNIPIYIHSILIDNTGKDVKRSYVIRKNPPGRAPIDVLFDIEDSLGQAQMTKWLAHHGMLPIKVAYHKVMYEFMSAYIGKIQNTLPEVVLREHLGWADCHDRTTGKPYRGFVVGKTIYSPYGEGPVSLVDKVAHLAEPYHSMGTLETWKYIPDMYRRLDQKFPQLMMCGAFGAPFMRFNNVNNLAFNLWDIHGGKGKSNALKAVLSVWGDPRRLMLTRNETLSARYQKFSFASNLPIGIDEITMMNGDEASNLLYDAINGQERGKSLPGGLGVARTGFWETLTFMTSNRSLYEVLRSFRSQTEATSMRLVEWRCDFKNYSGTPWADYIQKVISLFKHTYGVAGPTFLKWCFAHPEVFKTIPQAVEVFLSRYSEHSDERVWMSGVGTAIATGRITCPIGLLPYNMDELELWCADELFPVLRGKIKAAQPTGNNLLAEYMNEHMAHTLIVKSANRPKNMPDPGKRATDSLTIDPYVLHYPTRELYNRLEDDTKQLYVTAKHFAAWLQRSGLSLDATLDDLTREGIYRPNDRIQVKLGKSVASLNYGKVYAYAFDGMRLINIVGDFVNNENA